MEKIKISGVKKFSIIYLEFVALQFTYLSPAFMI